jgi:cytochrome c
MDTLHKHALEGFQGQTGFMPPKGGRVDLADDLVMQGVDYMVEHAR